MENLAIVSEKNGFLVIGSMKMKRWKVELMDHFSPNE